MMCGISIPIWRSVPIRLGRGTTWNRATAQAPALSTFPIGGGYGLEFLVVWWLRCGDE
jgi:hypothetical protein